MLRGREEQAAHCVVRSGVGGAIAWLRLQPRLIVQPVTRPLPEGAERSPVVHNGQEAEEEEDGLDPELNGVGWGGGGGVSAHAAADQARCTGHDFLGGLHSHSMHGAHSHSLHGSSPAQADDAVARRGVGVALIGRLPAADCGGGRVKAASRHGVHNAGGCEAASAQHGHAASGSPSHGSKQWVYFGHSNSSSSTTMQA